MGGTGGAEGFARLYYIESIYVNVMQESSLAENETETNELEPWSDDVTASKLH